MSTMAYFTIPKLLETDPRYASLSIEARYLYGRMRDTRKLSAMNGWKDGLGVYIKMARETIARVLGKSLPTVRRILRELKDVGLIYDIRIGLTQCNRIYVMLLPGESENDLSPAKKEETPSEEKQGFTPDRKASSGNKRNPIKRNPNNPNHKRWFLREGSVWMDENGKLWEYSEGDIHRHYTRSELRRLAEEAMGGSAG